MKIRVVLGVLAVITVIAAFSICAVAGTSNPGSSAIAGTTNPSSADEIMYRGQLYCVGNPDCEAFAFWGPTAAGYVELTFANGSGQVSDYVWVDFTGHLWFESYDPAQCGSSGFCALPPAGLPLLGELKDDGSLQQISQFFPGGVTRPLAVQSDEGLSTPEPSTLLLFGPAALFLFGRARRFWRG